ncbi:4-hydroxy-3-methylbut-2-enyl diphosphate reductase [Minwuia thermotolerans]|uniref:4-hydroxy-3-methylbut-2-enyl diphosphate reductase n=1 Tax=Minwuia thermotolerans TaxID=2056226 RepID=A0A2M9G6X3_9PROT|nr:4-hydroxy-3-methylbut-2-enyl diphosphate reductase [Minwuia thermotolerans]PJK31467.1 4-hydroxy-3-methylbut-2-enyl diphosphate reductase [Minwuia thermotolerans]
MTATERAFKEILLANPRGFCAGVERAIQVVDKALDKYGAPVYVRHEIVHNRFVVEGLEKRGAVFVEELDEVPSDAVVVFSAHGVPKWVPEEAQRREQFYLDATCPLVSKVHVEAERHYRNGRQIVMIGHAGHPEVIGTMGQLPDGAITLIENTDQADALEVPDPENLAFITQTTLSVDDTAAIVDTLVRRFPTIHRPHKEDICYATTNRQAAVKEIASRCDVVLVVGAQNSSNSKRLVEVAEKAGCPKAILVPRADELDWSLVDGAGMIGLTAGASAPDVLVEEVLEAFRSRYDVQVREVDGVREEVVFRLPRALLD